MSSVSWLIENGPICSTGRRMVSNVEGMRDGGGRVDRSAWCGFAAHLRVRALSAELACALKSLFCDGSAMGEETGLVGGQVMSSAGYCEVVSEAVARNEYEATARKTE